MLESVYIWGYYYTHIYFHLHTFLIFVWYGVMTIKKDNARHCSCPQQLVFYLLIFWKGSFFLFEWQRSMYWTIMCIYAKPLFHKIDIRTRTSITYWEEGMAPKGKPYFKSSKKKKIPEVCSGRRKDGSLIERRYFPQDTIQTVGFKFNLILQILLHFWKTFLLYVFVVINVLRTENVLTQLDIYCGRSEIPKGGTSWSHGRNCEDVMDI